MKTKSCRLTHCPAVITTQENKIRALEMLRTKILDQQFHGCTAAGDRKSPEKNTLPETNNSKKPENRPLEKRRFLLETISFFGVC